MSSRIRIVHPGTTRRHKNIYPRVLVTVPRPTVTFDYFTDYKPRENKKVQLNYYMDAEDDGACECGVCLNSEVRNCKMVLLTDCGHSVCDDCLNGMAECASCNLVCPFCREDIDNVEVQCGESFGLLNNNTKVFK